MREKWNVKKKGFLKIHIAVYVKTKKIFSMKVTDEHVHDSKVLLDLVNDIVKSNKIIGKLFADDGAYEGNNIFRCMAYNGILPYIKVRKNSNLSVISQKNDLQRWIVETIFSSKKRMFGEYIYSVRLKNMIQEMMLKAILYNKIISI
jgi:DDE family transposase